MCEWGYGAPVDTQDLTFRPFAAEEFKTAYGLLAFVFADAVEDEDLRAERSVTEFNRSLAAFDSDQMVGCLSGYSFDMSVPGGSLPVGGTTWVGVSPTHRRRGILRQMMWRHLEDVAERGEPLAALWASEASIYGRFGYGPAIDTQSLTIAVDGALKWHDTAPDPPAAVRLVPLDQAWKVLDPIHRACRRRRAGMHVRNKDWWYFQALNARKGSRGGANNKMVAVAQIDGQDAAYAIYGLSDGEWATGRPDNSVKVIELAGVDAAAESALWRYLFAHDLVAEVSAPRRPVDDTLPLLLSDSRRVQRRLTDALHVRVTELAAALRGRSYAESVGFTVEVVDDLFEANDGIWQVEVAPEGAAVQSVSTTTADLRMPIRSLGALYMGDISLHRLASAGMVEVSNPAVLPSVDAAFRAVEAGWAPEVW